ncbi:MAG: Rv3654c family TadE-like protein [Nocardioidaceae bacterium]
MAAVFALFVCGLLVLACIVATICVSLSVTQHRAAGAADLSALAGAAALQGGHDACAAAQLVARRSRARVTVCVVESDVVDVHLRVESPRWWGHSWWIAARARAGPIDAGRLAAAWR